MNRFFVPLPGSRTARPGGRWPLLGLIVAVAVAVIARAYPVGSVFREGAVVLQGNDPYYVRYVIELYFSRARAVVDPTAVAGLEPYYPLTVVLLGSVTRLVGSTADAAGTVLAWYPVVFAAGTVLLVYATAAALTGERWVGVVTAAVLALTPIHVQRTALGYADHHAFDYLLLAAVLYLLVRLAAVAGKWPPSRTELGLAAAFGTGVAAQILAWRGGLLLVVPVGVYAVVRSLLDVREGRSPGRTSATMALALWLAAALVLGANALFDWHSAVIVGMPVLLAVGVTGTLVVGEFAHWVGLPASMLAVGEALAGALFSAGVYFSVPQFRLLLSRGIAYHRQTVASGIVESSSLVNGPLGVVTGPFSMFGPAGFLAFVYLGLVTLRLVREDRPAWVAPVAYGWPMLALALLQRRFAGELSLLVAVFAGVALVDVARRLGVVDAPSFRDVVRRSSRTHQLGLTLAEDASIAGTVVVALLVVLVVTASSVLVPAKVNQTMTDGDAYEAASYLADHAEEHELSYPDNYVFSSYGRNRMYNYVVSYHAVPNLTNYYAKAHYLDFLYSNAPAEQYATHAGRVGYVVTADGSLALANPDSSPTMFARLHHRMGSAGDGVPGTGHYRAVYVSDGGAVKAFRLVPGAVVTGRGPANATVSLRKSVSVPGRTFTYERRARTTTTGRYAVRIPYPGTYDLDDGQVVVSERMVTSGEFVSRRSPDAHWPLNDGRGDVAYDVEGGHHGWIDGPEWVETPRGRALRFEGDGTVRIPSGSELDTTDGFSLSVWFRTSASERNPRIVSSAPDSWFTNASGYQVALSEGRLVGIVGDDTESRALFGPDVADGKWHHAVLTWNRTHAKLFLDGERVADAPYGRQVASDRPLVVGATTDGWRHYRGVVGPLRFKSQAVNGTTVRAWYRTES